MVYASNHCYAAWLVDQAVCLAHAGATTDMRVISPKRHGGFRCVAVPGGLARPQTDGSDISAIAE
jgi:hypothetical protein